MNQSRLKYFSQLKPCRNEEGVRLINTNLFVTFLRFGIVLVLRKDSWESSRCENTKYSKHICPNLTYHTELSVPAAPAVTGSVTSAVTLFFAN